MPSTQAEQDLEKLLVNTALRKSMNDVQHVQGLIPKLKELGANLSILNRAGESVKELLGLGI